MGVAACLRWESRMAQITTTHRHDFRWPTTDCLVPRAEAPNGHCVQKPPASDLVDKPWCGRDKPQPPTNVTVAGTGTGSAPPRVCYDLVPTPGDRPWCQRGPLVPQLDCRTASAPPPIRSAPAGCEASPPARPWCEDNAPPRVVSARVGAAPEQDTSRYDQPNQYLRKLCDKFPNPASVLMTPRDELMRRVYADRYRTTYQSDYCRNSDDTARMLGECDTHDVDNNKYKPTTWDNQGVTGYGAELGSSANYEGGLQCTCGCKAAGANIQQSAAAGDGGEPRIRPIACRPAAVSKNFHFTCCTPRKRGRETGEQVGPPEKIPPWVSEYNDSIGKTGQLIIEQKLLYPSKPKKAF